MTVTRLSADRDALIGAASRRLLTTTACALALLAGPFTMPVMAQTAPVSAATRAYDIPAQPLANALRAFGRQSGLQVSLPAEAARGANSAAVSGTLSTEAALSQLLSGTGLSYRISNGTVVVGDQSSAVSGGTPAADGSTVIGEINITGQRAATSVSSVNIGAEELAARNPDQRRRTSSVTKPGVRVGAPTLPMSQKVYVNGVEETNLAISIDGSRQNNARLPPQCHDTDRPDAAEAQARRCRHRAGRRSSPLAGSIAYETKDVKDLLTADGFGGMVSETYNSNSKTFTTGLGGWAMQDGFEFLGFLNYGKGDNYEAGNGDEVRGTETNLLSGLGKFAYEAESGDRFEFSHERVRDDAERPYRANASVVTTGRTWEPPYRNYKIDRDNTVFTYTDTTPEGWWDPTIRLAYSHSSVQTPIFYDDFDASTDYTSYDGQGESGSLNGKFENKFALENGNIVAGLDFYSDKIELDTARDSEDATERARNIGIYTQARIEPLDAMRLSFGGRADKQWFEGTTGEEWDHAGLSGNASVEYDLTSFLTAKAGVSHVWAGIPLAEAFIMNPGWNYGVDGPEVTTSNNATAGLEFHHQGFTAEGSLFRSMIQDARVAKWAAARSNLNYDVETWGFEVGAGYDWTDGFIKVKYARINAEIDGKPADSDTGNYLTTPVGDIITVSAAHTFSDWGLTVGTDMEFAPEFKDGTVTYADYEVVNIYTEWKPEQLSHMTFRAEVQNLLNETYASRATYGQEFGNVTPLYEQGRTFLLSVKATF